MANSINYAFPITLYGSLEEYNQVLSKGRCRIFYKGGNRNRTYITEEFAEQLISTLPYTPVKGIYDGTADDYTDHGRQRYEGKIYGIVPENPNFAWETNVDADGVMREYACVDVLLFTSIYKEASEIVGQAQSMELYAPSIEGTWKYIEGKKYFVFTEGCFLGLQVLGKDVEPCFEGASFYTNQQDMITVIQNILDKLEIEYSFNKKIDNSDEGGESMVFKLSDNQKYNMLWSLLNPNFTEEGDYVVDYVLCDIYNDYAIAYNLSENGYERVYYTKDDDTDSVEITERETAYIVDVNESELKALKALQQINDSYEKVVEEFTTLQTDNEQLRSDLETKETEYASLNSAKEELEETFNKVQENYSAALEQIESLTQDTEALKEFKVNVETAEKEAIIDKYSEKLSEEFLNEMREKISEYDATDLEKELAFALVNVTPTLFTNDVQTLYPKEPEEEGLGRILSKYNK